MKIPEQQNMQDIERQKPDKLVEIFGEKSRDFDDLQEVVAKVMFDATKDDLKDSEEK
tara:strand:- start:819 stop:989 length:171 start_codon:yes stop_codon:yes gene_type:complete